LRKIKIFLINFLGAKGQIKSGLDADSIEKMRIRALLRKIATKGRQILAEDEAKKRTEGGGQRTDGRGKERPTLNIEHSTSNKKIIHRFRRLRGEKIRHR